MAQGFVQFQNQPTEACINGIKESYAELRRIMDRLIIIRNTTEYDKVAFALGCLPVDPQNPDYGDVGLKAFDNLDAAMAGLTTAYNALSNMDQGAL